MKKIFLLLLLTITIVFSCKTIDNIEDNPHQNNNENENIIEDPAIEEKEVEFEFVSASFSLDKEAAELADNRLYKAVYALEFNFINKDDNFKADLEIYDVENNLLFTAKELSALESNPEESSYTISESFSDFFMHSELRFKLAVSYKKELFEYSGDLLTTEIMPFIERQTVGPVITTYVNHKLNTNLLVEIVISKESTVRSRDLSSDDVSSDITSENPYSYAVNYSEEKKVSDIEVDWVRIVPPDRQSYWELPLRTEDNRVIAAGPIGDSKRSNYIDNGTYMLQISFGRAGLIQQEFELVDFFNNEKGPNYGLPVATQVEADKNDLKLEINLLEKLDYMELHIYGDVNGNIERLGIAKFYSPLETIPKKDLMKMIFDDYGNKVKLKHNKDYLYEIYLYSKRYNELDYVSISKKYKLTFQGFGFPFF